MSNLHVEPTAEAIDDIAKLMRQYADSIERDAAKMRKTGDLTYAAVAINTIVNCLQNMRLDLLITRSLTAQKMEIAE